jgi:hypothetical protein
MNLVTARTELRTCFNRTDSSKVHLAVNWKKTPYKNWSNFCKAKVPLSESAIYGYLKTAELIIKYHYFINDCVLISKEIGWCRFQAGLTKITTHISPYEFISTFKDIDLNERVKFESETSDLVKFSFSIPKEHAEILTAELIANGMRETNRSRTNSSAAMVKIINKFVEDN